MNMSAKIMPRGWMNKPEPYTCRLKMWRVVHLTIGWAVFVVLGLLMLWINRDGTLPKDRPIYWIALAPGPILITFIVYFRLAEQPRTFHRRKIDADFHGPVIH